MYQLLGDQKYDEKQSDYQLIMVFNEKDKKKLNTMFVILIKK